jgi:hypothetical protein
MKHKALIVFTGRSPTRVIREGGSQAWALNPQNAKECEYLVCTQNRKAGAWADPTEPHGEAFLVGKISGVVRSKERQETNRYLLQISEFAKVKISKAWRGDRNPVRYGSLEDIGIDLKKLSFEPMPELSNSAEMTSTRGIQMEDKNDMKGETGWFSREYPESDRHAASLSVNDDGTITILVKHSGQGPWTINLESDQKWSVLTGEGSCSETVATVTWAFMKEYAPRRWRLTGEWIEDGETYHWWADLIETKPCRERLSTLTRESGNGEMVRHPGEVPAGEETGRAAAKTGSAFSQNRPKRIIDFESSEGSEATTQR